LDKSILYITIDGLSDPLGQSQILPYLTGFAENGYRVFVISCEKKSRAAELERIKATLGAYSITWDFIPYDTAGGFLSRMAYVLRMRRLAVKRVRKEKISLTHCRSYLAALIGLHLERRYRVPFLFDMRGLWADERMDGGIWRRNNPLHRLFYNYFKRKERAFVSESAWIVSLTVNGLKELQRLYGDYVAGKTTVIPCCTDLRLFDPGNVSPARVDGLSPADHVIVYTGSVGTWYYIREMIECTAAWRQTIPNLKLLIVTKDQEALAELLRSTDEMLRAHVVTAGVAFTDIPRYLAVASAAIFFIKPSYSKIASSPTKMAECWAMNLPVITNPGIGDNDYYFREKGGGILVSGFTEAAYEEAASQYLGLNNRPSHYRQIAMEDFDQVKGLQRYLTIYRQVAG
jgi:glycosyltransferase involved in cell wall biosynthesis